MAFEDNQNSPPKPSFMDGPGPKFITAGISAVAAYHLFNLSINATPEQLQYINMNMLNLAKWLMALNAVFQFGGGMMQVGKNLAMKETSQAKNK